MEYLSRQKTLLQYLCSVRQCISAKPYHSILGLTYTDISSSLLNLKGQPVFEVRFPKKPAALSSAFVPAIVINETL